MENVSDQEGIGNETMLSFVGYPKQSRSLTFCYLRFLKTIQEYTPDPRV